MRQGADGVIEEMIIRKELADNFCFYNPDYDKLRGMERNELTLF